MRESPGGRNTGRKDQTVENLIKLLAIVAGMVFLFCIWLGRMETGRKKEAPEGEKISREDVHILMEALGLSVEFEEAELRAEKKDDTKPDADRTELTYGQYQEIYEQIGGAEKGIPDFADKYKEDHAFLKEDWYQAYQLMLAHFDTASSIWKTTVFILKVDEEEKKLFTQNSEYVYCSSSFANSVFSKEEVYVKGEELLTSIRVLDEKTILENVWVRESIGENGVYDVDCFYHQLDFAAVTNQPVQREQVADLTFENGELTDVSEKQEKIRGKLLRVADDSMEIEGYGIYEMEPGLEIYKLCGTLESQRKEDLMIGYDYTDFVIADDKIAACLVSREGEMEQIRVLLKNTQKGNYYFDRASVYVDGEQITVEADAMAEGERRTFQSKALTDRVKLEIAGISYGDDYYRGALEFYKSAQGMVIINELPLEEYLYAVVPSEMPASYPMEALKAQAVCARTYAFRYVLHAGFAAYGAHLDNTTSYQVYHNLVENAATTTAVNETSGMMLYYGDELADNYYYSTSCGYGTDTRIWKSQTNEAIPYIPASKLAPEEVRASSADADEMGEEALFSSFITGVDENDFESREPWYRWQYEVTQIDIDEMLARIKERYQANASLILTKKENGEEEYYVSEPVEEIGTLQDIMISKRGPGGVADEMLITGSRAVIKVISEHNIRRILCDGISKVTRQDGSSVSAKTLLPSGFFVIETGKSGEDVVGYSLTGGGYGHGVGMSQNGAKEMGSLGYSYQEILKNFFTDCEVRQ